MGGVGKISAKGARTNLASSVIFMRQLLIGVIKLGKYFLPFGTVPPAEPQPFKNREISPVGPDEEGPLMLSVWFPDNPIAFGYKPQVVFQALLHGAGGRFELTLQIGGGYVNQDIQLRIRLAFKKSGKQLEGRYAASRISIDQTIALFGP
jgi:hypothetical protein